MISLVPAFIIAVSTSAAQDSASMQVSRICSRAVESAAPVGRPELAAALAAADAGRQAARSAFLRGCQRLADRNPGKASEEFERAVKLEDANPVYHFWLARSIGDETDDANPIRLPGLARRARSELERAVALAPTYLDARDGLVQFYLAAPAVFGGSVDKARAQVAELRRIDPYRGELAGLAVARHGRDTTALIRGYEAMIAAYPDSAAAYSQLALVYSARRQWDDAWRTVDRWNAVAPTSYAARYALGRTAAESGQRGEAGEKALRDYLTHTLAPGEPSIAAAHWRLGMILEKRGDREGARREYETSRKLDPALAGPKDGLARLAKGKPAGP